MNTIFKIFMGIVFPSRFWQHVVAEMVSGISEENTAFICKIEIVRMDETWFIQEMVGRNAVWTGTLIKGLCPLVSLLLNRIVPILHAVWPLPISLIQSHHIYPDDGGYVPPKCCKIFPLLCNVTLQNKKPEKLQWSYKPFSSQICKPI